MASRATTIGIPVPDSGIWGSNVYVTASGWPRHLVPDVVAVEEVDEELAEQLMIDGLRVWVCQEALLRRVCGLVAGVDEHVIPRLTTVRLRLVRLVPRLIGPAHQIKGNDDAPVPVTPVPDQLADPELRSRFLGPGGRRAVD